MIGVKMPSPAGGMLLLILLFPTTKINQNEPRKAVVRAEDLPNRSKRKLIQRILEILMNNVSMIQDYRGN